MTVDRGGLRYPIEVVDQFSEPSAKFQAEMTRNAEAFAAFRREVEGIGAAATSIRSSLTGLGTAASQAARANRDAAASSGELLDGVELLAAAERALIKDINASRVSIEKRNLADEAGVTIYRQATAATEQRQGAEEALSKLQDKRQRQRILEQIAEERGISLRTRNVEILSIETRAQQSLTKILEKRAVAERAQELAAASGVNIGAQRATQAQVEAAAQEKLTAILDKKAVADRLSTLAAEQGLALNARRTAVLDVEAAAAERLAAVTEKRAIEDRVAQLAEEQGIALSKERTVAFDAEAAATDRITQAQQRLSVEQALLKRGFDTSGNPLNNLSDQERAAQRLSETISRLKQELTFREAAQGSTELKQLQAEIKATDDRANRISFTFRRLFGILAAFAAVRAVVQGFKDMVSEAIDFNANIEQANLGIASLFVAVGDVRDAFGNAVEPSRQIALAQKEAARQTSLLRLEALQTAATFEQLVTTFQTAIAPGVEAGFDVDRIRKFTVAISQAAAAVGVAQNQLAEEIRSILTGTIQARTTRIATALGITNEDIRNAKELGTLAEFLDARFRAFAQAGKESLNLFTTITTNLKDALFQLIGAGSTKFFESLKNLFKDIQASIVQINSDGVIINPKAEAVVEALFEGLRGAVEQARQLFKELDFQGALSLASGIGTAFKAVASIISTIILGVVRGIETVGTIVEDTKKGLSDIANALGISIPTESFKQFYVLVIQILTTLVSVRGALLLITTAAGLLLLPFNLLKSTVVAIAFTVQKIQTILPAIGSALSLIVSPVGLILIAFGGLVALGIKWLESATGVELKFGSIVDIVGTTLMNALRGAIALTKAGFLVAINAVTGSFKTLIAGVVNGFAGILDLVKVGGAKVGIQFDALDSAVAKAKETANGLFEGAKNDATDLVTAIRDANKELEKITTNVSSDIEKALKNNDSAKTFDQFLGGIFETVSKKAATLFQSIDLTKLTGAVDESKKLSEVFEGLPGIIGQSADRLSETGRIAKELKDDLRAAAGELEVAQKTAGLTGIAQRQVNEALSAEVKGREKLIELNTALKDAQDRSRLFLQEAVRLEERRALLTDDQQKKVQAALDAGSKILSQEQAIEVLRTQQVLKEEELKKAKQTGAASSAQGLQKEIDLIKQQIDEGSRLLDQNKKAADQVFSGVDPDTAARLQQLTAEIAIAQGKQKQGADEINAVETRRLEIEGLINASIQDRLEASITQELPGLQEKNAQLALELQNVQKLSKFRESAFQIAQPQEQEIAQAEAQLTLAEQKVRVIEQQNAANEKGLQDLIKITTDDKARLALEKELALARQSGQLEVAKEAAEVERLQDHLQTLIDTANSPIEAGLFKGLNEFITQTGTAAEQTARVTVLAINSLVDQLSGAITDALFNTQGAESGRERLLNFVRAVVNAIIQELIRLAIVKAIALAGLSGGGSTGGGTTNVGDGSTVDGNVGVAKGGLPGRGRGRDLHYHYHRNVQSFPGGGKILNRAMPRAPKGLDPRDRIPIWARKDEFVVVPEAWKPHGLEFMTALNNGLISPLDTAAMLESKGISKNTSILPKLGYATGSLVIPPSQDSASQDFGSGSPSRPGPSTSAESGATRAYVVADEQSFDRQLAQGRRPMMRFIEDNASQIANILDSKKPQR